jgi:hypothetical protein
MRGMPRPQKRLILSWRLPTSEQVERAQNVQALKLIKCRIQSMADDNSERGGMRARPHGLSSHTPASSLSLWFEKQSRRGLLHHRLQLLEPNREVFDLGRLLFHEVRSPEGAKGVEALLHRHRYTTHCACKLTRRASQDTRGPITAVVHRV